MPMLMPVMVTVSFDERVNLRREHLSSAGEPVPIEPPLVCIFSGSKHWKSANFPFPTRSNQHPRLPPPPSLPPHPPPMHEAMAKVREAQQLCEELGDFEENGRRRARENRTKAALRLPRNIYTRNLRTALTIPLGSGIFLRNPHERVNGFRGEKTTFFF